MPSSLTKLQPTLVALGLFAAPLALPAQAAAVPHLDDGARLLQQARIPLAQAVAVSDAAVPNGRAREVDLVRYRHKLVYNVDAGRVDVAVDATTGVVVAIRADDRGQVRRVERRQEQRHAQRRLTRIEHKHDGGRPELHYRR
jgi:hypothetical protein